MIENVNLFDGHIPYYKITKPIRLIELFAGIGSQHQALKNLGVKIDRSTIVEWQVNSIQAYNDIHIRKYDDHTQGLTKEDLAKRLSDYGVSIDYNQPAKIETLMRKGEEWLRNVYNNIINTNNKVNIMSVKGKDLEITETDKYDYVLTYSFPCQDLSKAGLRKGMSDTNTRSGLLWEVERILSECKELPQILLMENVPDVIGSKFIKDFQRWESRLRELGYSNHTEILNSKDFGIPQNRERAFMVSILGSSLYNFPQKQPLKLRLKDMLEKEVDEKYYLSEKILGQISNWKSYQNPLERTLGNESVSPTITTRIAESIDGGINASMLVVSQELDKEKDTRNMFRSKDKRLPEMLNKIDFTSNEPQSLDLYNCTVSDISQTLTLPNHNAQAVAIKETKEFANYITWEDDKGRLNTQDHRAYFEDRLSGTIPAMERGVPNVLLNGEPKVNVIANINPNGTSQSGNVYDKEQLSPTLCASDYKSPPKITEPSLVIPEDTNLGYALAHEGDGVYTNRPEQKRGVVQKQMIQTIKANSNDLGVVVYDDYNSTIRKDQDTIGTLTTNIGNDALRNGYKLIENQLRIRKLTPRECYRLMGFGDQAFELAQPNQSNSSLYHQAGDSIVVNVLMGLFGGLL
jgi:DNA (cytosine-5)-methyltransferase 1